MENTTKKELIYSVSDSEMNKKIVEKIVKAIENKDYNFWRCCWQKLNTPEAIYYQVIDKNIGAKIYTYEPITFVNILGLPIEIEALKGKFLLTMNDIKWHKKKLKKGSKGIPTYKLCHFDKALDYNQMKWLKQAPNYEEIMKKLENTNHYDKVLIAFDYKDKEEKNTYSFWNYCYEKDSKIYYQKHQYVLEYLFDNEDLEEPINVKELWNVGDRPVELKEEEKIELLEKVKADYIERSKVKYQEKSQDRAFYTPTTHSIILPLKKQFSDLSEYYQVMFHEMSHSTGHETLLNRKGITDCTGKKTKKYAKEELVAELSSCLVLANCEYLSDSILENTISYLASWQMELDEEASKSIARAYFDSLKASDLILNIDRKELHKYIKAEKKPVENAISEEKLDSILGDLFD